MAHDFSYRTCGMQVDAVDIDTAYERLAYFAGRGSSATFHFVNAYTLSLTDNDADYAKIFRSSELNLPDGMPLAWVGRHLGGKKVKRISGSEFFAHAVAEGRADGLRHYLYGSTPEVGEALARNLTTQFPGAQIAAVESPPFRRLTEDDEMELAVNIGKSGANVLWVGLGTPKQDILAHRVTSRTHVPVLAIGAAFDFVAGMKKRAPVLMQRAGMEWLHRLASEPRRLGPRYIAGNARFIRGLLRGAERL